MRGICGAGNGAGAGTTTGPGNPPISRADEISRVARDYPHLTDDAFIAEHLDEWMR